MFKKIFLLILGVLALISPVSSFAVEPQYVYVESLTLPEKTSYNQGEKVEGSFVLRNAGDKDAGDVFYKVLLTKVDSSRPESKGFLIVADQKFGPIAIGAKSKSSPISFALDIPKTASGDNFEVKIEAVSASDLVLSWADSKSFSIGGESVGELSVTKAFLSLNNEVEYGLQVGPTIYGDKDPKIASFVADIENTTNDLVDMEVVIATSERPFKDEGVVYSEKKKVSVGPGSKSTVTIVLPTQEYKPGVYEGRVFFKNLKGEDLITPLNIRYIVGGEIVTIHSLTSDKPSLNKGEQFNVIASITGSPFDITYSPDTQETLKPQLVDIGLTILNENGTIIAEDLSQDVDLNKMSNLSFDLVASKKSEALKGVLTVSNKEGKLLATYEAKLSANYQSASNLFSLRIIILVVGFLAIILLLIFLIKKGKRVNLDLNPKASLSIAILFSVGIIGSSLYYSQKVSAGGTPLPAYNYNTNDSATGLVYKQLFSFYHGRTYEGINTTTSQEHFVNNGWGPRFVLNVPIDAEYEVGESFDVGARVTYASCGNTPLTLDVGASADATATNGYPVDGDLGLDIIATADTGMTPSALKTEFINAYPYAMNGAQASASTLSRFDSSVVKFTSVGGRLRDDDYVVYVEGGLDFGTPVYSLSDTYKAGFNYDFSKTLTAPVTPGIHKLWIGSVISNHKNFVTVCIRPSRFGCSNSGEVNIQGQPQGGTGIFAYTSEQYQKIKAYQNYKVLPPKPETISFDSVTECGRVIVSWTQNPNLTSAQIANAVNTYKLYRKINTVDSDYVLISDSIAGNATSFTDALPVSASEKLVYYRLIAHHNNSNFDSRPKEGSVTIGNINGCNQSDAVCGSQHLKSVNSGAYDWTQNTPGNNKSDPELCSRGFAEPDRPTAPEGVYNWICEATGNGAAGGLDATCKAYASTPPACGTKHTTEMSSWPVGDAGLCATGNDVDNKNFSLSTNRFQWGCMIERVGEVECYATKPPVPPSTPTVGTPSSSCSPATTPDVNTISLEFETADGTMPVTFEIWRSTTSSGTYAKIGESNAFVGTNKLTGAYDDATVTPGITYYYKIRAKNTINNVIVTSDFSTVVSKNTPAVCQSIGQCGPAGDDVGDVMYVSPQNTDGLCSVGSAMSIATDNVNRKYTWICDGVDGDAGCSANMAQENVAECGDAEGKEYSTTPSSTWNNLCRYGFNNEPKVNPNDSTKYIWTCTSLDGNTSDICEARKPTWFEDCTTNPSLCPEDDYPKCGNVKIFDNPPNELTYGLCSGGVATNVGQVNNGPGFTWQCVTNKNGVTRSTPCSGELKIVNPPPRCPDGTPLPCVVNNGNVVLNDLKTYPRLINKGNACSIFVGKNQGLFHTANEFTRCKVYAPDRYGSLVDELNYSTLPAEHTIQEDNVFTEGSFRVSCYQVTINGTTGAEIIPPSNTWVTETAQCKINPSSVETSFFDRTIDRIGSMSASIWNAFAKFFNLK